VDELARPLADILLRRLKGEAPELVHPAALEHRANVESSAVEQLGELRPRERRSPQRADRRDRPRVGAIRDGCCADDRSVNPAAPSARKRAGHLRAVRSLMPANSAVARTVTHLSRLDRSTTHGRSD
jgi:hypothetical protein